VKAAWDENTPAEAKPFIIYGASKTEGERAAWNWVKENKPGFAFNAVLPNLVVSEMEQPPFLNLSQNGLCCSLILTPYS
jgi:nucleoside-diphosphate-sugar epimerase